MAAQEEDATKLYKRALKRHVSPKTDGSVVVTDLSASAKKGEKKTAKVHKKQTNENNLNPYTTALKRHVSAKPDGSINVNKIEYDPTVSNILIIGGSSSIGLQIVQQMVDKLKDKKYRLYVTGYPDHEIAIKSSKILYHSIDLTQPNFVHEFESWLFIRHKLPNLDLVIYCAETEYHGEFMQQSPSNIVDILDINYKAPVMLTKLFQPYLLSGNFSTLLSLWNETEIDSTMKGKLVFLGSNAVLYPAPDLMVYSAAKAALKQFVTNLRYECSDGHGINVSLIQPPPTKTSADKATSSKLWTPQETASKLLHCTFYDDIEVWLNNKGVVYIGLFYIVLAVLSLWFENLFDVILRITRYEKRTKVASRSKPRSEDPFKYMIINGGSHGLGLNLTHCFANNARQAWNVVNIAEREGVFSTHSIECDLASKEVAMKRVFDNEVIKGCDVFIHDSAMKQSAKFEKLNMQQIERMIQANLVRPILMTHELLHKFANRRMVFVFVASLSNYVYCPNSTVFSSTTVGIANFARSLEIELFCKQKYNGSDVLIVCPGATECDQNDVARAIYRRIEQRYVKISKRGCNVLNMGYKFLFNRTMIVGWKEYGRSWFSCLFPHCMAPTMAGSDYSGNANSHKN